MTTEADGSPVIILVEPQLGENIGMAARAMLNCGLTHLRIVNPRDGWPNESAVAASADAAAVIDRAQVFTSTAEAVADLRLVFATTARSRDMTKRIVTPRRAAREIAAAGENGTAAGILFGRESKGLANDDVALADAILSIPVNPDYSSLNLAQAVYCIAYEWLLRDDAWGDSETTIPKGTRPADKRELIGLFEHLEEELDESGFLHVKEKRPIMVRNLRNLLQRAELTEQEVRTLRGVITSLSRRRRSSGR